MKSVRSVLFTRPLLIFAVILLIALIPLIAIIFRNPHLAQAAWYNGAWRYRKELIFDNSAQASNLTSFPVMVKLSSTNFNFSQAKTNGADLRFTDSDGTTLLSYEIEKYNPANQTAVIWVNVPQIDASSTTDSIYIYWGNSQATDAQSADNTWNSNYKGVYHLNDSASNTTVTDSSGNSNTITASSNTNTQYNAPSGQIAGSFLTMGAPHRIPNIGSQVYEIYPDIKLDSSDFPVVAYYEGTTLDLNIVHCNDRDCTGDNESVTAPDTTGTTGQYPSIALDSSGYPVVAYYDSSAADLNLLHCNDANCSGGDDTISSVDSTGTVGLYPSMVLDGSGYPVIAYYDSTNTNVKLVHCNDANCSGGNESTVTIDGSTTTVGNLIRSISVTLDSSGYPVIVYYDNTNTDLKMTRCNDANCSGGDETTSTIVTSANDTGRYVTIRLDGSSYPMISFEDWTNRDQMYLHCNDTACAGGDDTPVTIDSGTADYSEMEINSSGFPIFVYDAAPYPRIAACADANCSSNTKTYLGLYNVYNFSFAKFEFDSSGNIAAVGYSRGQDGQYDVNLYTTKPKLKQAYDADFDFGTGSFSVSAWFKAKRTGKTQNNILLSRYDTDQGFKLWLDYGGQPCFGIDDDSSWGPDDRACPTLPNYISNVDNSNTTSALNLSPQLDSSGYPVIAINDGSTQLDLELIHCTDANCSGTKNFASIDSAGDVGRTPSMVLDSSGYPVIAYHDNTNNDLKLVHCGDANCSAGNTINTVDSTGDVGDWPSLKLDSSGYPVIAYDDNGSGDLKLVHCNDANCSGGDESIVTVESTNDVGNNPSLQLDSSGYPVIAHTDVTNNDLRLINCNDANCSGSDETATNVDSSGTTGYYPSLVLDSSGYPVIAHYYGSAFNIRLTHCSTANCSAKTSNHVLTSYDNGYAWPTLILNASGYPVILHTSLAHWTNVLTTCNDANCSGSDETNNLIRGGNSAVYNNTTMYQYPVMKLDASGYPVIAVREINGDVGLFHLTSATYSNSNEKDDGSWHHLVGVKNGTSSITLYVDGTSVATDSTLAASSTLTSNSAELHLAEDITSTLSNLGWGGWLDEVQIDNTARSSAWVGAQYKSESDTFITYGATESHPATNGPIAWWSFDESQGQYTPDSSINNHQGTLGADSSSASDDPTRQPSSQCSSGSCLYFDGTADYTNVSQTIQRVKSLAFWIKPASTTTNILSLNGSAYITASAGTLTATGFTSPTIYVNGVVSSTITANTWQYVVVTTTTPIIASATTLGKVSTNYYQGFMDEVKLYNLALSASQVKNGYNNESGTVLGIKSETFLTSGLVGYWKLDESSGNAADSSGNGLTLTNNATTTYVTGKFSNGSEHVPASLQYLNTATTIAGVKTVSFWVNPDSTTNYFADLDGGTNYISAAAGTISASGFTSPTIYVNGIPSTTLTADTWQYVTVTTNTAISASAFALGKIGSSYFDGTLDEVRVYNRTLSPKEIRDLYNWAPGPVGYWNFDEKTGQSINDISGNGNAGTLGANSTATTDDPTWSQGKYGGSLKFDGSNDLTTITNPTIDDFGTGEMTVMAWIKTTGTAQEQFVDNKSAGTNNAGFNLQMEPDGDPYFRIANGSSQNSLVAANFPISNGQWHHVAGVLQRGTADTMIIYVDGIRKGSTNPTAGWNITSSQNLIFGNYGSGAPLSGSLDDVKIYNYARTPTQIVEDINAGHPAGGSPVGSQIIKYGFDEQQGITANNDVSANSTVTGSISGATWKTKENCKLNGCLDFDGTDDVTTVTNTATIDLNDNLASGFTVSTWIYPDTAGEGSGGQIFYKGTNTWLRVDTLSGGKLDIQASLDLATTDATLNASAPITQSAWNHVALSYTDDADDEITIWVNGVAVGTSTDGAGAPATDTGNLLLGGTTTDNFDGKIDEFKLYSSELTKDQINIDNNLGFSVTYSVGHDSAADFTDGTGNPPVAYWNFNEKTGQSTNDTSGNSNTGTLGATSSVSSDDPTWTRGKYGSALNFDGSNDTVPVGSIALGTTHSLSLWVKTNNPSASSDVIVGGNSSGPQSYMLLTNGTGLYYKAQDSQRSVSYTLTDGQWYHIDVVRSGTSVSFYVNGVQAGTTQTLASDNTLTVTNIGSFNAVGTTDFAGSIDDVKIYNYARTPAQVAYDYNRGAPLGWWQLDECSGTTANDMSPNSYTGTITIGALGEDTIGTCQTSSTSWGSGATGKYGASLSLDGSDDSISVADTANLRFDASTADFSLLAWVKRTTTGTEYILSKEDADNDGWRLMFNSSNQVVCSEDSTDVTSTLTITNTSWHLVGCTIDRDGNGQIYIDGKADGAAVSMGTDAMTTAANLTFGTRAYTATSYLNGQIDDIKIFNYALSPAQVKKIMNEGSAVRFGN